MSLDRYHFAFTFDPSTQSVPDKTAFFSDTSLTILADNVHPAPRRRRLRDQDVFLFGNPIANGRRGDDEVLEVLGQTDRLSGNIAELNGSFLLLIYDRQQKELTVANDRFASLSLQLRRDGRVWQAASSLKWLWDRGASNSGVDETGVAQLLLLRRLFGDRTLANGTRYLPAASILRIAATGEAAESRYFRPDYSASPPGNRELPGLLAERLQAAVAAHQSDARRFGLLLSGGLDSRALLAAARRPLDCYTTCLRENNESAVARAVAEAAGARFLFVSRPSDLYDRVLDDAVFLTGGQQTYVEAQFLGYRNRWPDLPETFFIGLGLDIFFGGLYLPKAPVNLLGRPALHYRLKPIAGDFANAFLNGVSYRLKQSDPNLVIKKESRFAVRGHVLDSLSDVAQRGQSLGAEQYDLWEYMHIDTLSRHYSFPMMMSVRTYADCRAPAFDNDLFDLSVRMSADQKVNGTAYQRAIALLSPALGRIRNANTNLPASMPLPRQSAVKAVKFALNRIFGRSYPHSPSADERSWPTPRQNLAGCPSIVTRAKNLAKSERLAAISFIDMDGVRLTADDHFAGRADHAVLLNLLLTLDSFLTPSVR